MKSIERRFVKLQQSNPASSSYINFASAIGGGRFTSNTIRRWFSRLVDKEEYTQSDKTAIFAHLDSL